MWTRCLRGNHVECCQGQVVGRFITGHPIRNQQKAEAVLSPHGGVGGCCRVVGCVLLLDSQCQKPWGPGGRVDWGGDPKGAGLWSRCLKKSQDV